MAVSIVGAGLAGSEAALVLARLGIPVCLIEMKPKRFSPAHSSGDFAELVCSNSLRSSSLNSAVGLLKEELRLLGSIVVKAADINSVPAGKALAVDRTKFSEFITTSIEKEPLITVERREACELPCEGDDPVIVATGPLTSDSLASDISERLGASGLYFYDAIAPIVYTESLDMNRLFRASRYEAGEGDYLNAPMDRDLYYRFVGEIRNARKVEPHQFEKMSHFEGCLPVEELASRGEETLAFGPMKPVGLMDPKTGSRPHAVVQLRAENEEKTLYNLVGFQTKMTYPEQERVFRMIPGLEKAVFARLGSSHRNTYLDSPLLLDNYCRSKKYPNVFFAGQITGVEGYCESAASGFVVGLMCGLISVGVQSPPLPPVISAIGGLMRHTRVEPVSRRYEPMNVNFGMIEGASGKSGKSRRDKIADRAIDSVHQWKSEIRDVTEMVF